MKRDTMKRRSFEIKARAAAGFREREIMRNAHTVRAWAGAPDTCVEYVAEIDGETRTAVWCPDRNAWVG